MRRVRGEPKPGEIGPPKPKGIVAKEWFARMNKRRSRFAGRQPAIDDTDEPQGQSGRGYWRRGGLGKYRPGG